jgi:hypothetical protein
MTNIMKIIFNLLVLFGCLNAVYAQTTPPGIPYQAIARNANGTPYVNANLTVRFSLHEQTATGTVSYAETKSLQTNDLGLFSTTFGSGTPITGTFAGINWAQTTKFLQVEINLGSAWVDMGTQQLMSVPYAMYAEKARSSLISGSGIIISGDTISSSNNIQNILLGGVPAARIGINTSTTWTCPAGVTKILVEVWGAAGGGGSGVARCVYSLGCGGGVGGNGGNGGYNRSIISVVPGQTYSVEIGSGGLGGGDSCPPYVGYSGGCNYGPFCGVSDGTDGGSTNFHGLVYASGGTGGKKACIERLCSGWVSSTTNGESGQILNYPTYSFPSFINPVYMSGYSAPGCCTNGGQGGGAGCPNSGSNGDSGYCIISY